MKNLYSIIVSILLLSFLGCNSPKIMYTEYKYSISKTSENQILESLDAKDSIYSVLIFTEVFKNDILKVQNGKEVIFQDTISSDSSLGLAKSLRVFNHEDILITDISLDYSFILKKSKNMKYKYIYIEKKKYENNEYTVTYSNTHRAFY